jgi:hypothetical protein
MERETLKQKAMEKVSKRSAWAYFADRAIGKCTLEMPTGCRLAVIVLNKKR